MKHVIMRFLCALVVSSQLYATDDGWISLFDGKTLNGWKANEAQEAWKVEENLPRATSSTT